jgi:type IV fimbrial biogenesis protein FimT
MMLVTHPRDALIEHRGRLAGFTLIELLITVVVLSILLALAVPAFRSFMQNDQQWVQQNNLVLSLNTARSEAIKNDLPGGVQVCSSTDGATCTATPWEQGWIVLPSANVFGVGAPKAIQTVGALPTGTTLRATPNNTTLSFLSNGALTPAAAVAFKMCDIRGAAFARYLQVTAMGRVVAAPTVGQDLTGAALTCP